MTRSIRRKKPRCNRDILEICKTAQETITPEEVEQFHKDQCGPALQYLRKHLSPAQFKTCIQHHCSAIEYVADELTPKERAIAFKGAPCVAIRKFPEEFTIEHIVGMFQDPRNLKLTFRGPMTPKFARFLLNNLQAFPSDIQRFIRLKITAAI
jgi:hypothetical protein